MTTAGFDAKASDEDKSRWAESDAPIDALARNLSPEDSKEADAALAIFKRAGRPRLDNSTGNRGRAPRRQVRLPEALNRELEVFIVEHDTNVSEVIRVAVHEFLHPPQETLFMKQQNRHSERSALQR